jgi:hypothetical protein
MVSYIHSLPTSKKENLMCGKIISIETDDGPFKIVFTRVMRMVPDRDKNDTSLQRLIAFRLKNDGEETTRQFLISKIREMIQCAYSGRLYDFIKDDEKLKGCGIDPGFTDPPEIA